MDPSVLIIDDDRSFRRIVELRLKSFYPGAVFTVFDDLSTARSFLTDDPPPFDLVVLDQHLPDGRGVDFMTEGHFRDAAVLTVSSDDAPEIPGASLGAGASFFLNKTMVSEPLFRPLIRGIIEQNRLQAQLNKARTDAAVMETVRTLVATLRHEINNPLGAVLGAAYLLRATDPGSAEHKEAASLVESSGKRIKHVLDRLCDAVELSPVSKASHTVFHIPGDKPWGGAD